MLSRSSAVVNLCPLPLLSLLDSLSLQGGLLHLLLLLRLSKFPLGDGGDFLSLGGSELSHASLRLSLRLGLEPEHPLRNFAAGLSHDADDRSQVLEVLDGEECYRLSLMSSSTRSADSVDVGLGGLREVVVHHGLDAFEVDTACEDVGTDEHPGPALAEGFDGVVSLGFRSVSVYRIHEDAVIDELAKELLGPVLGLHEDEARWLHFALLDELPEAEKLVFLVGDEGQSLLDICCGCVHLTNSNSKRICQDRLR
mmetsp:Transcript_87086/g.182270  ORF Transcript_87086/g.182270 Transcript_87086/m.182270 type:complete len:254 (+) Transcript_87086:2-763(+)